MAQPARRTASSGARTAQPALQRCASDGLGAKAGASCCNAAAHRDDQSPRTRKKNRQVSTRRDAYADQIRYLAELGSRASGTEAHNALIDRVAMQLAELGLEVKRDPHTFERWDVDRDALALQVGARRIAIASAWPYSGETSRDGITAPLILLRGRRKRWRAAAGKIAVIEVPHVAAPASLLIDAWDGPLPFDRVANPIISSELAGTDLAKAKQAGVLGVIAVWRGLADAAAADQYLPFTRGHQGLPAVWVPESERVQLLAAAARGEQATLILAANRTANARMDTVWAVSPGTGPRANESVLVVTHSDGGNAVEENGHIGLLALARDAVAAPHARSIVFVYTAGHLRMPAVTAHGQATSAWLQAHPELWAGASGGYTAAAGLAIEHLGAKRFHVDPSTGRYAPDGTLEPELLYATTPELARLTRRLWSGASAGAATPVKPGALLHFGEGEPLFQRAIPAVALVTGPEYLLAECVGDLVDIDVLIRQVDSFRRLLERLAGDIDRDRFGKVVLPSKWNKALAAIRIGLFLLRRR